MKSFAAVAALVGAVAAHVPRGYMVTGSAPAYTTVTATAYTTYCPESTTFEYNSKTYTVTEPTTLTITDCPDHACTYVAPITTSTSVYCSGGGACYPSSSSYGNYTAPAPTGTVSSGCSGYDCNVGGDEETPVEASSASKVAGLSGLALAGVLAVAAYL